MKKFLLVFVLFVSVVWGCTIIVAPTADYLKSADVVFVGKVTKIVVMPIPRVKPLRKIFTFKVSSLIKGDVQQTVNIYGPLPVDCDKPFDFQIGEEYVVFGYFHPAVQWLHKGDKQGGLPNPVDPIITSISSATDRTSSSTGQEILKTLDRILKDQLVDDVQRVLGDKDEFYSPVPKK